MIITCHHHHNLLLSHNSSSPKHMTLYSVPELKSLERKCNKVIVAYEKCLIRNETTPENCIKEFEDLYNCTESNSSSSTSTNTTNTTTITTTTISPTTTEIKT